MRILHLVVGTALLGGLLPLAGAAAAFRCPALDGSMSVYQDLPCDVVVSEDTAPAQRQDAQIERTLATAANAKARRQATELAEDNGRLAAEKRRADRRQAAGRGAAKRPASQRELQRAPG